MSAVNTARSTRHAEGVDKVRALQRVLYRCAKQDPRRRFHALYDKVARSDVLRRAWAEVLRACDSNAVNGVGERLAGEPHEPFEGEGLDTDGPDHGGERRSQKGNRLAGALPTYRRPRPAPIQSLTRLSDGVSRGYLELLCKGA